jgi:biopolymer transport protein ExbB
MSAAKPTQAQQQGSGAWLPFLIIILLYVVAFLIWKFVFGANSNFIDNDNSKDPLPGNYMGTIYKGGFVVPLLLTTFFTVIVFVIERFITLGKASGAGNADTFVRGVKSLLDKGDIQAATAACDKQKGAVANVVRAGLVKYSHIADDSSLDKEQKVESLKKELEEATSLELPMLSKNLVVLSTCASIATLIGLIGTVLGMIRSFAAMSKGSPDTAALSTGISEALINTAFGISASTLAIIFYNVFSNKVDGMTYSIDEASFTIVQDFSASQK